MRPRIFKINDLDHSKAPLRSAIINNDFFGGEKKCCPVCRESSIYYCTTYLIQGYDDFLDADFSKKAFLGFEFPPFFAKLEHLAPVFGKLNGTVPVKVGYSDWNQSDIPEQEWFEREPKLAALEPTSTLSSAYLPDGRKLKQCAACGMTLEKIPDNIDISELSLDFYAWNNADLFKVELENKHETVITEKGLTILKDHGLDNLICQEIYWHDA